MCLMDCMHMNHLNARRIWPARVLKFDRNQFNAIINMILFAFVVHLCARFAQFMFRTPERQLLAYAKLLSPGTHTRGIWRCSDAEQFRSGLRVHCSCRCGWADMHFRHLLFLDYALPNAEFAMVCVATGNYHKFCQTCNRAKRPMGFDQKYIVSNDSLHSTEANRKHFM